MSSQAPNPKILYRNSRLLRMVFLQLHRQQRADLFCDVVLQAEGEAVPAHCCILSACSPFFTERLEREMPPKGHKVVLEIRGLKIGTLRKLVDFLYTSEMEVSQEEAQDILAAARQLQVSELESLQLEGGKLVKKSLGPRLNRGCLQLSSPISVSKASLVQSSSISDCHSSLTSWMVTGKQHRVMKPPCSKVINKDNSTEQKEIKKQKPSVASLSGDKQQISKGPTATAEPLKTKAKKRPSGMVRSILDNSESGALHEETSTVQRQPLVGLKESKMIKLHRSKVSSAPSPVPSATKDHSTMMSGKVSRPNRRLWRQKSHPGKDEAKDAEDSIHSPGFWSPPVLPKPNKSRKHNSSEPAPSSDIPSGARQIGRVKLRKVIDGSCWEVVQESPATQPARAANTAHPLKDEVSQSQPRYPVSVADGQQSANSAKLLPAKQETVGCSEESPVKQDESKVAFVEGDSTAGILYDLNMFMTEHVAEVEQYGSLASAGELLDLLLADAAAAESQVTAVPEGTHMACPAQGGNKSPLKSTGAEEKSGSLTEVSVSALLVETEKSLQREQEATDLETLKEIDGSSSGCPLLDPVLHSPSLEANESISDSPDLCRPVSLNDWTVPEPLLSDLENGAARFTEPLPFTLRCDEDQGALSYETELLGTETKPCTQAVDYKLPCIFASLEEEELDVGGLLHREMYSSAVIHTSTKLCQILPSLTPQSLQCMENILRSRWHKEQNKC